MVHQFLFERNSGPRIQESRQAQGEMGDRFKAGNFLVKGGLTIGNAHGYIQSDDQAARLAKIPFRELLSGLHS